VLLAPLFCFLRLHCQGRIKQDVLHFSTVNLEYHFPCGYHTRFGFWQLVASALCMNMVNALFICIYIYLCVYALHRGRIEKSISSLIAKRWIGSAWNVIQAKLCCYQWLTYTYSGTALLVSLSLCLSLQCIYIRCCLNIVI